MDFNIDSENAFDNLSTQEKMNFVCEYYNKKVGSSIYATSPDFNLRELEIDFILSNISSGNILDLGCGNGYTLMRIAEKFECNLTGVDFSDEMIDGANKIVENYNGSLLSRPYFYKADASKYIPINGLGSVDTVITERFLLNLPSDEMQYEVIKNVYKILKSGGKYIMVEGSKDGLDKLNGLRQLAGLKPILDRDKHNLSSRKFDDDKIINFLSNYFTIVEVKTFDLYYIISRIIYPKLIAPEEPSYSHEINKIARDLTNIINVPSSNIGHVKGYVLIKQ